MPKRKTKNSKGAPVAPKTVIAKIIARNPRKNLQILEKVGLHCLHCPWSALETLEQGAKAHGWNKEKMNKILEQLNQK